MQAGGQAGRQVCRDQLYAVGGRRRADGCQRRAMPHGPAPRCAARRPGGDEGAPGSGECSGLPCTPHADPEQAAWAGWVSLRDGLHTAPGE